MQCHIVACGGLPLNAGILDVLEHETNSVLRVLLALPVCASCVVVDAVDATLVEASGQLKIVDAASGVEPTFVADNPSCLQAGEDTPTDVSKVETILGLMTETAAGLCRNGELCEVLVLEVVVGIEVVCHVYPIVLSTAVVDVLHVLGDIGQLIVLIVITTHIRVAIAVVVVAPATEEVDGMSSVVVAPLNT